MLLHHPLPFWCQAIILNLWASVSPQGTCRHKLHSSEWTHGGCAWAPGGTILVGLQICWRCVGWDVSTSMFVTPQSRCTMDMPPREPHLLLTSETCTVLSAEKEKQKFPVSEASTADKTGQSWAVSTSQDKQGSSEASHTERAFGKSRALEAVFLPPPWFGDGPWNIAAHWRPMVSTEPRALRVCEADSVQSVWHGRLPRCECEAHLGAIPARYHTGRC